MFWDELLRFRIVSRNENHATPAALTRSFQAASSVAKTGEPGRTEVSLAALASLRARLMTFHATLRQNLGGKAPDCGSCSSQQHDGPGARVRGKGVASAPVRIAISSSIALRRSPKPGAFTAATFSPPRSLLTTRLLRAIS